MLSISTRKNAIRLLTAAFCLTCAGAASAVPVTVVFTGSGELLEARDVNVNGTLYRVEFLEGSCFGLFSGCDQTSDFAFQTEADALAAAQALLDTVLLSLGGLNWDLEPALIRGCEDIIVCDVLIPWSVPLPSIGVAVARNGAISVPDAALSGFFPDGLLFTAADTTWAVFTPTSVVNVSEPGTLTLLAAVIGFAGMRRRRDRCADYRRR